MDIYGAEDWKNVLCLFLKKSAWLIMWAPHLTKLVVCTKRREPLLNLLRDMTFSTSPFDKEKTTSLSLECIKKHIYIYLPKSF